MHLLALLGMKQIVLQQKRYYRMNFHNNAAFTKVLHTLQQGHTGSKQSKQIYESVLFKHCQIIQTFLQKINSLYNKQQQFENSLSVLCEKVDKLESGSKNIHYEFRTTHLMIDKRLSTIVADFNAMQEQMRAMQMEMPIDSYLNSTHFLAKSSHLRSRSKKERRRQRMEESMNVVVLSGSDINDAARREEAGKQEKLKELGFKIASSSQTCQKITPVKEKMVGFSSLSSHSSKGLRDRDDREDLQEREEEEVSVAINGVEESESEESDRVQEEWVREEIRAEGVRLQQQFSARIAELQGLVGRNRQELQGKMVKQEHIAAIQSRLTQRIDLRAEQLRRQSTSQGSALREQVRLITNQHFRSFEQFESKVGALVDLSFFKQSIANLSSALNEQFSKMQRFYANKLQTKKAIEFLEGKINRMMVEDVGIKSRKQFNDNDPCLKINKCESHKKLESLSEKSIKDIKEEGTATQAHKSLDTSMWEIEPEGAFLLKEDQSKLKRVISNISNFRTPPPQTAARTVEEAGLAAGKFAKSSSMPKGMTQSRVSLPMAKPEPQVNLKEWRERVVKILKKQDRRKRKVTFR